jgi:DNA-binding NtrC family response regulator
MTPPLSSSTALLLLVADGQFRDFLVNFLESQEYAPRLVANPAEALKTLKGEDQALVFVDCQTVSVQGPGLYAKMKVACPHCRIVLLCDKRHHEHRDIVKEAMDLGIYACLLAPFAEWEVLAMVRHSQVARPPGRRQARTRGKQ